MKLGLHRPRALLLSVLAEGVMLKHVRGNRGNIFRSIRSFRLDFENISELQAYFFHCAESQCLSRDRQSRHSSRLSRGGRQGTVRLRRVAGWRQISTPNLKRAYCSRVPNPG